MHLVDGPNLGHSMIYHDGKLENIAEGKSTAPGQDSNPLLHGREASALPLRYNRYHTPCQ